jgi:MFS family permease
MDEAEPRQSRRFLFLYALAAAGGAVAYVPFLTILLPVRVGALAGDDGVKVLALAAFCGAVAASLANIAFGWLSDRTGTRRPWIALGLALSAGLLVAMREVDDTRTLIVMIVAWQLSLNMMLAPLSAWAGDCVPDAQKGTLGGLLALAPALGALSGALVTWPGLAGGDARLMLVAVLVAAMVLPALLAGRPRPMPHLMEPRPEVPSEPVRPASAAIRMWLARLLVQIAEAALFAYLLFWFQSIDRTITDNDTAAVFSVVLGLSVPLALAAGRWSDRAERPILPLVLASGAAALGLFGMAAAGTLAASIAAYVLFGLASSVFLALHASQTLRVLPRPEHRGRDLGVFNLTNTVPSLVMPWLTVLLVPVLGFGALFAVLGVLSLIACLILATLRAN